MRIPNAVHEAAPWRIRAIVPDFVLEDLWQLPVHGGVDDLGLVLEAMTTADPNARLALPARFLWAARDVLGRVFDLGRISTGPEVDRQAWKIPGTAQTSLVERLPAELVGTASDVRFDSLPFSALFRTSDEFAAELSNATVHAVLHLAWVPEGNGRYGAQMAVYVKTRGRLGSIYMAAIKPFRYLIVYPALMRQIEKRWQQLTR
ncbi:MAG: hypothetical protein JWP74_751 [Marmoricola sp.]|nr:hypothetical protein [Marmoricola sp.]